MITSVLEVLLLLGLCLLIWLTVRSGTLGSLTHPPKPQSKCTEYDVTLSAQDNQMMQENAKLLDRYNQLLSGHQMAQARHHSECAEREYLHGQFVRDNQKKDQ